MALTVGTRIGPYEVVAPIGAGGMGEVYRATDTNLKRAVALKVLPESVASDADRLARFQREAEILAALNHPNIAHVHGLEKSAGITALVMELVEGEDLAARIAHGRIPLSEALEIARQIADALDAAHERGIIHRDLKPANVKVRDDGTVKVLDFGLAKALAPDAASATAGGLSDNPTITSPARLRQGFGEAGTQIGMILGTAAYMSPEQARGKPVDKRTDIWAFGCVLYEMITGRAIFTGDTISDVIARILEREPDWGALPHTTPASVRRLLTRCLQKDPRLRLRDIADAREDLVAADSGARAITSDTAAVPAASARLAWLTAAALAIALVVTLTLWRRAAPAVISGSAPPTLARATRVTNSPAAEFGPAISPDNKWVAYYSSERGPIDVWVKFLDNGTTLNLTEAMPLSLPVRTGLGGLAVSPDGTRLAFYARLTASQELIYDTWVIPMPIGGSPRRMLQGMQGLQWSPDGSKITCILPGSSRGDMLVVAEGDGSKPAIIVPAEAGHHIHWPVWSRDGRHIYFIYTLQSWNTEPAEIYRVSAAGGKPEPVVRSVRRAVYPVPLGAGGLIYAGNPDRADLGLWWQPGAGGPPKLMTTGVGEPTEARLSAAGTKLVATLLEMRQALVRLPVSGSGMATMSSLRSITSGYSGDIDPDVRRTGDRVVFSSSRSGDRNLWTANVDGTDPRPLTSGQAIDERPVFAPDGTQVAFLSDRGGQRGIWLVSAEGGVPRRIAVAEVLDNLTWSPDGQRIAFAGPGSDLPRLLAVTVADGRIEPLRTPAAAAVPAWSPTSDVIAYLEPRPLSSPETLSVVGSRQVLRFVDPAGQPVHATLPQHAVGNGYLAWAPEGRRLAQLSVPANSPASVWIIEPGSRTPFRKILDLPAAVRPRGVAWTRDGSSLILGSEESVSDIVLYDVGP